MAARVPPPPITDERAHQRTLARLDARAVIVAIVLLLIGCFALEAAGERRVS
jgi:hypothetical protein